MHSEAARKNPGVRDAAGVQQQDQAAILEKIAQGNDQ
jgi:hypothetical protein